MATLPSGTRLGVYEIVDLLGEGGMGEVYRARDTTLRRDVALKVLPDALAVDPATSARFEREARLLASLNHPHIATLFGLERLADVTSGTRRLALVMELVDGASLEARIAGRPLPLAEAVRLATQMADAVAYAHDHGVIHRDLKPANVKVTPEGRVKVLDFGIAKAVDDARAGGEMADTVAFNTEAGLVIGTAAYMSPEQASGGEVDRRTDVWAFGCVLCEMLTGRRAFAGSTRSDLIAAVLAKDPDWTRLPPETPPGIRTLLRRCLQRDRHQRLRDLGDAKLALEDAMGTDVSSPRPEAPASGRRGVARLAAVGVAAAALGTAATWVALGRWVEPMPPPAFRLEIPTPLDHAIDLGTSTPSLAISRDGRQLAWVAGPSTSGGPLTVRDISDLGPRAITGVPQAREPAFSPDGRWLAFLDSSAAGGPLRKVPVAGGAPVTLVARPDGALRGPTWVDGATIVFSTTDPKTGLMRVSSEGGPVEVLTRPDMARGEGDHLFPSALPGGRGVLFTIAPAEDGDMRVAVLDLRSRQITELLPAVTARYASGHLIYVLGTTLLARPFDLERLQFTGQPATLAEGVLVPSAGGAYMDVAATGTLIYVPATSAADPLRRLVWVDRSGAESPVGAPDLPYREVRLSPDGKRIALGLADAGIDVWTWDLARGALARLTTDPRSDMAPVWMPDGRDVVYSERSASGGTLYRQAADGSAARRALGAGTAVRVPSAITSDGVTLLGNQTVTGPWALFAVPIDRASEAGLTFPEGGNFPALAPGDRFVAFQSDVSGRQEIYVRPFPRVGEARWQVSTRGGRLPVWRRDGKELFYLDDALRLTAATVDMSGATVRLEPPRQVLAAAYFTRETHPYDVSPDGQRFLMIKNLEMQRDSGGRIVVVHGALDARR